MIMCLYDLMNFQAVYFTALFPYVVLVVLLGRAATLEGAIDGIRFYIKPKWELLGNAKVDALGSIMLSMQSVNKQYHLYSRFGEMQLCRYSSLCPHVGEVSSLSLRTTNSRTTLSGMFSHHLHPHLMIAAMLVWCHEIFCFRCCRDAVVVTLSNCATSIFAGFVIFSIIGFMAHQLNVSVEDVAVKGSAIYIRLTSLIARIGSISDTVTICLGPGLAFVAYPEVVAQLPISPLWSILFFLMLITLGLGSQVKLRLFDDCTCNCVVLVSYQVAWFQMTIVNTVYSLILDKFSRSLRRGHRPKLVLAAVCGVNFLFGIILCCRVSIEAITISFCP